MLASGDDGGGGGDASPMGQKKERVCMSSKEFIMWVMPMGISLHVASCI